MAIEGTANVARRVLLIEDDPGLVLTLTDLLTGEGYKLEAAQDGELGFRRARTSEFDVIILDINLPNKNGFDICRDLRQQGVVTPIIMLTARGQTVDKVLGLKLGADDYLAKPFEPIELLARLEALLRRAPSTPTAMADTFRFGSVLVDFRSTEVRRDGKPVEMSAREFQLLQYLVARRGETISRNKLLREVWGYQAAVFTRTVDVHMGLLRHKLEEDAKNPGHFITVRGFGYKFVE